MGSKTTRTICDIFNLWRAKRLEKNDPTGSSQFNIINNTVNEVKVIDTPKFIINKDEKIRNKFFSGYDRTKPINWFVIHGTAGVGVLRWMRDLVTPESKRGLSYKKGIGLFHYLIERNGTIWEIISPDKWVWHADVGSYDGGSIGVELENPSTSNAKEYTAEQYTSLLSLFNYLKKLYPTIDVMISHNRAKIKVNNGKLGGKECPGKGFDWLMWKKMVSQYYSYKHDNGESLWDIKPNV